MPENQFLSTADFISYPLVTGDYFFSSEWSSDGGSSWAAYSDPLPRRGLADATFIMGPTSGFDAAVDQVYLYAVIVEASWLRLDFRSTSWGLAGRRWLFSFARPVAFGTEVTAYASLIAGSPDTGAGLASLIVGDVSDLEALGLGVHVLVTPAPVEPARLQSVVNSYARSLNLANDPRFCPPACCSSEVPEPSSESYEEATGLIGDVKLADGWNCVLAVTEADNTIMINGEAGKGLGWPTANLIVTEEGASSEDCGDNQSCDSFIRSVNGLVCADGRLILEGDAGMLVGSRTGDEHGLRIEPQIDQLCVGE